MSGEREIVLRETHRFSVRDILLGVAVVVLLFSVMVNLPILGMFLSLLLPLPVTFYRIRLGRMTGLAVPAISLLVITGIIGGLTFDILFFLELLFLGFVLGEMLDRPQSIERTVGIPALAALGSGVIVLFLFSGGSFSGLAEAVSTYVKTNLDLTMALYESMGLPRENMDRLAESLEQIHYVLVRVLPGLTAISVLFTTWVNFLLVRSILKARHLPCPDFGPLNHWKAPDQLVWGVIGCGLVLFFPDTEIKIAALNVLVVLMMIYFFAGIAVVSFYFEKKKFPFFLKLFLYSLIAFQQVLLLVVIGIGFFDLWLNFRKLGNQDAA